MQIIVITRKPGAERWVLEWTLSNRISARSIPRQRQSKSAWSSATNAAELFSRLVTRVAPALHRRNFSCANPAHSHLRQPKHPIIGNKMQIIVITRKPGAERWVL